LKPSNPRPCCAIPPTASADSMKWSHSYPYTLTSVRAHAPTNKGVYHLLIKNRVLYVGKSMNLRRLLLKHLRHTFSSPNVITYLRTHCCDFRFTELDSPDDLLIVERQQIRKYNPPCDIKSIILDDISTMKIKWSSCYPYTPSNVRTFVPATSGIYRLLIRNRIFYIGQSKNLQSRLLEHLQLREGNRCIKRYLQNYSCFFRFTKVSSHKERYAIEAQQQDQFNPPCNLARLSLNYLSPNIQ